VAAVVGLLTGAALWAVIFDSSNRETGMPTSASATATVSTEELAKVERTRVFFGHQSVGMNILDGVPSVFSAHNLPVPAIQLEGEAASTSGEGNIRHAFIGENEKPFLKIEDFDAKIRSGIGDRVDVAMMKFCYVDIRTGTDVDALFARYRDTMTALERDYPRVTFIKVTVPLMTEPGWKTRVKIMLGQDRYGPAENLVRERLNERIRDKYAGDHLFDLAAAESTAPGGARSSGTYDGHQYYRLFPGYASDPGHLNADGEKVVAAAWLKAIAQGSSK
jgi:hypothetical protein